jgi:S-(hydroxymethyl)glutathione dehydrogenase / alcohol dehydrogenase
VRAAVIRSSPGTHEITEVLIDDPGPSEVLVRTVAVGLCHSDLHAMDGSIPTRYPTCLGHEAAGIVEAVGERVYDFAPGDHVISCLSVFCGHCEHCLAGYPNRCQSREMQRPRGAPPRLSLADGTPLAQYLGLSAFAEFMLVHEHALVKIVNEMPLDRAALIGCGVMTGVGAAVRTAGIRSLETVAVIGCGGIGLNCIQGAALAGAGRIIAVDRVASKSEIARTFGATDFVDASAGDAVAQVLEMTRGGVHHALEAIGSKTTVETAVAMLRVGGTATIIGLMGTGATFELNGLDLVSGERRVQGSMMGTNRFRVDMPRLVDLYLQGRLNLDDLVSATIKLEDINQGFETMKTGEVARSVIRFD